jgi:predicted ATP-dependent Lon-type protease
VTVPKLFVNNATGRIGLVGFWDVVAFDEFAGKKRVDKALVYILILSSLHRRLSVDERHLHPRSHRYS